MIIIIYRTLTDFSLCFSVPILHFSRSQMEQTIGKHEFVSSWAVWLLATNLTNLPTHTHTAAAAPIVCLSWVLACLDPMDLMVDR